MRSPELFGRAIGDGVRYGVRWWVTRGSALVLAVGTALSWPIAGVAGCACLCVDGALKTVCTSPQDMQRSGDLCYARSADRCPDGPSPGTPRTYTSPVEGVTNCRDVEVYDASAEEHIRTRLCDVRPGG